MPHVPTRKEVWEYWVHYFLGHAEGREAIERLARDGLDLRVGSGGAILVVCSIATVAALSHIDSRPGRTRALRNEFRVLPKRLRTLADRLDGLFANFPFWTHAHADERFRPLNSFFSLATDMKETADWLERVIPSKLIRRKPRKDLLVFLRELIASLTERHKPHDHEVWNLLFLAHEAHGRKFPESSSEDLKRLPGRQKQALNRLSHKTRQHR